MSNHRARSSQNYTDSAPRGESPPAPKKPLLHCQQCGLTRITGSGPCDECGHDVFKTAHDPTSREYKGAEWVRKQGSVSDEQDDINADALRFRWLCEHPDWHFIEYLCREFVADSSMEFLLELRRVIDARRSIELGPFEQHIRP